MLLPTVTAFLVALVVLRLGRWLNACILNERCLSAAYLLSASIATLAGLAMAWGYNRWQRFSVAEREANDFTPLFQEIWKYAIQPREGDQYLPLVVTAALVFGLIVVGLRRWVLESWFGLIGWLLVLGSACGLMYKVLATSVYMLPNVSLSSQIGNVVVPSVALSLGWLGLWLRAWNNRRRVSIEPSVLSSATLETANLRESRVQLVGVVAVAFSAALLLGTSGTFVTALRALILGMIPLAWLLEAWLPAVRRSQRTNERLPLLIAASESIGIWFALALGTLVIMGAYFGSIPATLGLLFSLSLLLLTGLWGIEQSSLRCRIVWALLAATPAFLAGVISVAKMAIALMQPAEPMY